MFKGWFCLCLFSMRMISATIVESMTIQDIEKYRTQGTLIIYDLDNTLIEPVQLLGSDQWFYYRLGQMVEKYNDREKALRKTLVEWVAAQAVNKVKVVEEGTAELIRLQQAEGTMIMGLTTRDGLMAHCTLDQLDELAIDLRKTAPRTEPLIFHSERPIFFDGGVLFTSGTHKGKAFLKFLELVDYQPKRVLFINDKYSNIKEVAHVCYETGIEFLGLRYGYLDEKIAQFNADIAEIQSFNFGNILSDEKAYEIFLEGLLTKESGTSLD